MRGFAIPHELAPALLVNSRDTRGARVFTLLHEFAHVLLGAGGVSNLRVPGRPQSEEHKIEVFCNSVAAEVLVPQRAFLADFERLAEEDLDSAIRWMSRRYSVSREVIARKLLDVNLITQTQYEERRGQYAREAESARSRQRQQPEMRIPRARIVVRNNGRQFTREVLAAYSDGYITARDVSGLLDTKLKHIPGIEADVFAARWQGATAE